jgi:lysophospholipase L1-like esterase
MFGGNDLAFGVTLSTLQANYTAFVNGLTTAGISVFHLLATARTGLDVTPLNNWIKSEWSNTFIDTYTTTWNRTENSTNMNSAYDSGDGTHPNDLGHAVIATTIQSSGKLPF